MCPPRYRLKQTYPDNDILLLPMVRALNAPETDNNATGNERDTENPRPSTGFQLDFSTIRVGPGLPLRCKICRALSMLMTGPSKSAFDDVPDDRDDADDDENDADDGDDANDADDVDDAEDAEDVDDEDDADDAENADNEDAEDAEDADDVKDGNTGNDMVDENGYLNMSLIDNYITWSFNSRYSGPEGDLDVIPSLDRDKAGPWFVDEEDDDPDDSDTSDSDDSGDDESDTDSD